MFCVHRVGDQLSDTVIGVQFRNSLLLVSEFEVSVGVIAFKLMGMLRELQSVSNTSLVLNWE